MTEVTEKLPRLGVLVGPTAVGKTALSMALGDRLDLEIVSADSRLLYKGMDIGTAKPTPQERNRVRHHLIDVTTPDKPWSLAEFRGAAYAAIDSVNGRGKLPLMVGGTGQYVSAVLEGWQPPPKATSGALRSELRQFAAREGSEALHRKLETIDPDAARHIDHRNIRRVIRALEIIQVTGELASKQRRREPPPYRILRLGLSMPRQQLYARIDARIETMLEEGWQAEVQHLMDQGYDFDTSPFSAIGYRQIAAYLRGELPLEQAKAEIRRLSRQFVRRQANWFKPEDERIHWYESSAPNLVDEVAIRIRRWLD